jgi:hypothetical protein
MKSAKPVQFLWSFDMARSHDDFPQNDVEDHLEGRRLCIGPNTRAAIAFGSLSRNLQSKKKTTYLKKQKNRKHPCLPFDWPRRSIQNPSLLFLFAHLFHHLPHHGTGARGSLLSP